MSWEEAWAEGRTGWDAGESSPALLELTTSGELKGNTALVPGCGAGYDAFALAEAGFATTGLEVSPTAAKRFETLRGSRHLTADQAKIELGDFFAHDGKYDVIWDYTFLCAIDPSQREAWATKMASLLAPNGELVTLIFPIEPIREGGPPFQVTPSQVTALLSDAFVATYLEPVAQSHPGREGLEWLGRWKLR